MTKATTIAPQMSGDEVGAAVVEDLVDDVAHDPGAEGRGGRDGQQAADREDIVPEVVAAVFGEHAPDHGDDLAGIPARLFCLLRNFNCASDALPIRAGRVGRSRASRPLLARIAAICLCPARE